MKVGFYSYFSLLVSNICSLYVYPVQNYARGKQSATTNGTNRINFIILLLPVKEAEQGSEMCVSNMPRTMDHVLCNILIKGHAFKQFKDNV